MTKREAYDAGHWQCPVPPVHTTMWNDEAWIRYIDRDGFWTVPITDTVKENQHG